MNTRRLKVLFLTLVLAAGALVFARPAQASVRVDVGFFYDSLAPYGPWSQNPNYGWVWQPQAVAVGWRPYTDGQWAYANEYGWTWASADPWGWATDHYGRWLYDPAYGWLWVPGYEWGPAWVDWVAYDDYVGWAPLPPAAAWSVNVGFAPSYSVPYDRYTFVQPRYLGSTSWQNYAVPRDRSLRYAREARRITRYDSWDGSVVNRSVTYVPQTRVDVIDVPSPRAVQRAVSRGELTVFRPQVARNTRIAPSRRGEAVVPSLRRDSPRVAIAAQTSRVDERRVAASHAAPARHLQQVERVRPQERRTAVVTPTRRTQQVERVRPQQRRVAEAAPARLRPAVTQRNPHPRATAAPNSHSTQHVRQQAKSQPHASRQVSATRHNAQPSAQRGGKPRQDQKPPSKHGNGHGRQ